MTEELRKRIARIISPKTSFEDFEGIQPSRFQMDRRRVAYEKADAVIEECAKVAPSFITNAVG